MREANSVHPRKNTCTKKSKFANSLIYIINSFDVSTALTNKKLKVRQVGTVEDWSPSFLKCSAFSIEETNPVDMHVSLYGSLSPFFVLALRIISYINISHYNFIRKRSSSGKI